MNLSYTHISQKMDLGFYWSVCPLQVERRGKNTQKPTDRQAKTERWNKEPFSSVDKCVKLIRKLSMKITQCSADSRILCSSLNYINHS